MTFLDTSYLIALASHQDELHDVAVAWSMHLGGHFLTTEYVLCEFMNFLSSPMNRRKAHALLEEIRRNPRIEIAPSDPRLFTAGLAYHAGRPDKYWSLTDCISFVLMEQKGIGEAFSHDQHFEQAGFVALLRRQPPSS
jgi:predicted nucleic acid-binding protein